MFYIYKNLGLKYCINRDGSVVLGNRALGYVGLVVYYHKTANRPNPITCSLHVYRICKAFGSRLAVSVSLSGVSFAHNRFAQPENVLNSF